jgi:hypothetical protein
MLVTPNCRPSVKYGYLRHMLLISVRDQHPDPQGSETFYVSRNEGVGSDSRV